MLRHLILAIAALAVVLIGAIELNGLVRTSAPVTAPAATPSAAPSPIAVAVDPGNCRLPVFVERGAGPPNQLSNQVGFVNTKTGRYTRDASATTTDIPRSTGSTPGPWSITYSFPVHRWLPTGTSALAPDGRSYAWIRTLPVGVPYPRYTSSELRVYDVATSTDKLIWTYAGGFAVRSWRSSGILVDAGPTNGGWLTWWVIDPATSAATKKAEPSIPLFKPLPGDPKDVPFHGVGVDAQGHPILNMGDRDKRGTAEWVFYETAPGQRVYIYRGTQGNAIGFNPEDLMADSSGIWFTGYDNQTIWHWQVGQKLLKVSLGGLPGPLKGANSYVHVSPAGACF